MTRKKRLMISAAIITSGAIAAFATSQTFTTFRTTSSMLVVRQGFDPLQYSYHLWDGSNLVALALGANPTSNQVFAMDIDCSSTQADLVVFDKSTNSNAMEIATSTSFRVVKEQVFHRLTEGATNEERFVAHFVVVPTNDLVAGFISMEGRLRLGSNGCPTAVLIKLDTSDKEDGALADTAFTDTEQDAKVKEQFRAGVGHFVGALDFINGGPTNQVLIPLGHVTFRHILDQD